MMTHEEKLNIEIHNISKEEREIFSKIVNLFRKTIYKKNITFTKENDSYKRGSLEVLEELENKILKEE